MFTGQRIIFDHAGTESDLTADLNDFRSGVSVIPFATATDYIYIASTLPFNHRHFEVTTANDVAATVKVEIWYGGAWHEATDVCDFTVTSGKSLAKSGVIRWTTDIDKGWDLEDKSDDVTGLSKSGIYDMYWVRLSWNANLKATTALSFIGWKFSNDDTLASYYPDMANSTLLTSFETGKTTWDEQHFAAAEVIVRDLTTKRALISGNQIVDFENYIEASCHKVAELVYIGLGRAFDENRKLARQYYDQAMNSKHLGIDVNANGRLDVIERSTISTGWMSR